MNLIRQLFSPALHDPKAVLLYRFHIVVIFINVAAVCIDAVMERYGNVWIELSMILLLLAGLLYLFHTEKVKHSAHLFIITVSAGLLTLIHLNHFATMSVVFILLIPLTTLIFLDLKESLLLTLLLFIAMGALLYVESLHDVSHPLVRNPQAIFNLVYTALIIYVFGLLYHFSILRTFKELDAANAQKALLLKEVHHRVKNNLNVIASIIGLQLASLDGKAKTELLKSKSRIHSIALVHEMLYRHENFESVSFTDYMQRLSDLLLSMYDHDTDITLNIRSDAEQMPLNVMVQLGIMLNELLTNSIKYAFTHREAGEIRIDLHKESDGYLFTYEDNGTGHPQPHSLIESGSLGMKLIHLTAKQLQGSVTLSSPKGLKYDIRFQT